MTDCIAVDWGTTNLRAWRLAPDGGIRDSRTAPQGILAVAAGGFEAVLRTAVGDWLAAAPDAPVLLSGMIGSRQGWVEVPYLPCPVSPAQLAAGILWHALADGRRAGFVPGVIDRRPGAVPDVMRGEEAQVFGALGSEDDGLLCLPGTHSKWVMVESGRIAGFTTHMTGEVFATLVRHSILGRTMPEAQAAAPDLAAFGGGLDRARQAGGLLHHLFGTRTLGLVGDLAPEAQRWYLSGLLIGHEIGAVLAARRIDAPVTIIGAGPLAALYARALAAQGVAARTAPETAAARGLHRLAALIRAGREP